MSFMLKKTWEGLLENLSVVTFVLFVWGMAAGITLPGETATTFQIVGRVVSIVALISYPFTLLLLDKMKKDEVSEDGVKKVENRKERLSA